MSSYTTVSLKKLDVISNSTSSIVQIGDRCSTYLYNQGISVKRNITNYGSDEPQFDSYYIFVKPLPNLQCYIPLGKVNHHMHGQLLKLPNQTATIEVDYLRVISNSQSSNVQLGNGETMYSENRQKAILQRISDMKKGCRLTD